MKNELCKSKRAWLDLRCYPGIILDGLRKTTKNLGIISVPVGIRNRIFWKIIQKCYSVGQLLRFFEVADKTSRRACECPFGILS
jgi:hypothetical protein